MYGGPGERVATEMIGRSGGKAPRSRSEVEHGIAGALPAARRHRPLRGSRSERRRADRVGAEPPAPRARPREVALHPKPAGAQRAPRGPTLDHDHLRPGAERLGRRGAIGDDQIGRRPWAVMPTTAIPASRRPFSHPGTSPITRALRGARGSTKRGSARRRLSSTPRRTRTRMRPPSPRGESAREQAPGPPRRVAAPARGPEQLRDRFGEGVGVVRRHEDAGSAVDDDLADAADVVSPRPGASRASPRGSRAAGPRTARATRRRRTPPGARAAFDTQPVIRTRSLTPASAAESPVSPARVRPRRGRR